MSKKKSVIFFIGRPGCGKGTQIQFLKEKTGFEVIRTGEMLRKEAKKNSLLGKIVKDVLEKGKLIPTPVVFSLWMPIILKLNEKKVKGVIFDGNPRKLYEAHMLEELFSMLKWDDPYLLYLQISEKESFIRLQRRGREDDRKEDIKERLRWFKKEVEPVAGYYRKKKRAIEVDGEDTKEKVWKEIEKKLRKANIITR